MPDYYVLDKDILVKGNKYGTYDAAVSKFGNNTHLGNYSTHLGNYSTHLGNYSTHLGTYKL